jgi:osmotically-inducible protein OsmY
MEVTAKRAIIAAIAIFSIAPATRSLPGSVTKIAERRLEHGPAPGQGSERLQAHRRPHQEDVSDRLSDDGALDASNIEVSVTNGEVQLNGSVSSKWAKRRAEDCAENVSGVTNVQNNLRIETADTGTIQQNPNLTDLS